MIGGRSFSSVYMPELLAPPRAVAAAAAATPWIEVLLQRFCDTPEGLDTGSVAPAGQPRCQEECQCLLQQIASEEWEQSERLIRSDTSGQQCAPEHRDTRSHWTALHFLACKGKAVLSRLAIDSCNPVSFLTSWTLADTLAEPRGTCAKLPKSGAPAQGYRSDAWGASKDSESVKCGAGTPRIADSARGPGRGESSSRLRG